MEGWILITLALLMSGVSFYMLVRDQGKMSKPMVIYSIIATLVVIGITWTLIHIYEENTFAFNLKRVCLLGILWPIAYTDIKEYRVPNSFIALGLIYRGLIIPVELLMSEPFLASVLSEVVAIAILLGATVICKALIKNAIGAGDMKLFIVMGLLLGLEGIWGAMFSSLIISFFVAAYLLIRKKKSRNDNIPFGPAIALGTFLSIWLTGM